MSNARARRMGDLGRVQFEAGERRGRARALKEMLDWLEKRYKGGAPGSVAEHAAITLARELAAEFMPKMRQGLEEEKEMGS